MKLPTQSARFLIACLTLGIAIGLFSFSRFSHFLPHEIKQWDADCVRSIFASETRVTSHNPDNGEITVSALAHHAEHGRGFQLVTITDDPNKIFESSPPSALDYAVILKHLHDHGAQHIAMGTRMSWPTTPLQDDSKRGPEEPVDTNSDLGFDGSQLSYLALNQQLGLFQQATIALPVTRGPVAQALPAPLKRSLIPLSQVKGNNQLIPIVNQVTLHPNVEGEENTLAGFHRIESSPESPDHLPMLARWESNGTVQGIIPSFALLTIMSAYDTSIHDLQINCGKNIRLGHIGPVIPIDEFGQTPAKANFTESKQDNFKGVPQHKAEQLISSPQQQTSSAEPDTPAASAKPLPPVFILHANGQNTRSTNAIGAQPLSQFFALCTTLQTPGSTINFQRVPILIEISLLLVISLVTGRLASLSAHSRHLSFLLLLPLTFIALLALMEWNRQWFGISAPSIAILAAWLVSSQLKRTATSDPNTSREEAL